MAPSSSCDTLLAVAVKFATASGVLGMKYVMLVDSRTALTVGASAVLRYFPMFKNWSKNCKSGRDAKGTTPTAMARAALVIWITPPVQTRSYTY